MSKTCAILQNSMFPLSESLLSPPSFNSLFSLVRSSNSDLVSLESAAVSVSAAAAGHPPPAPLPISSSTPGSTLQLQHFADGQLVPRELQPLQHHHQPGKFVPQPAPRDGGLAAGAAAAPAGDGGGVGAAAATAGPPELDTYSTDSSTVDEDVKRRRRKLHFPFGKKFSKSSSKKTQWAGGGSGTEGGGRGRGGRAGDWGRGAVPAPQQGRRAAVSEWAPEEHLTAVERHHREHPERGAAPAKGKGKMWF